MSVGPTSKKEFQTDTCRIEFDSDKRILRSYRADVDEVSKEIRRLIRRGWVGNLRAIIHHPTDIEKLTILIAGDEIQRFIYAGYNPPSNPPKRRKLTDMINDKKKKAD